MRDMISFEQHTREKNKEHSSLAAGKDHVECTADLRELFLKLELLVYLSSEASEQRVDQRREAECRSVNLCESREGEGRISLNLHERARERARETERERARRGGGKRQKKKRENKGAYQ